MNIKQEKAVRSFREGLNCAQAVITAYSEELGFNSDLAERISVGFGGGMGRLQETCGAATGAFMALGLHYSNRLKDNKLRKEAAYRAIQDFASRFETANGSLNCKKLINADLRTEEGQRYIKEHKLHDTVCEKCIKDAIAIVEELTAR